MKNSIARKIILIVAAALFVFSCSMIFVINRVMIDNATDNAVNLLGVFEEQIIDGKYKTTEQYDDLVKRLDNAKNIRVTVIDLTGNVLADTLTGDIENIENHLNRYEVSEAARGNLGIDMRKSQTFNVNYIYAARKVSVDSITVVLRVAVPVSSINAYLMPISISMAVILLIILVSAFFVAKITSIQIISPIELVKKKLLTVGIKNTDNPIVLTKYDEINEVLSEIETLSSNLDKAIIKQNAEQEKLNFILENINQGIIAIDSKQNVVLINKTAMDLFDFETALPTDIRNIIRNQIISVALDKTVEKHEYQVFDITNKDNRVLEFRLLPIDDSEISAIIVVLDVTDLRKLQIEKQEFFQNASHELNTPLTSILGYSEIILKEQKYNATFIEAIHKEAFRMRYLISDMLKIAELEQGKEIVDEPIEVDKIIENAVFSFALKAETKNIKIATDLIPICIYANAEKITEVVCNLLDNSIKYTENGGTISLSLKKVKGRALFTVKDNGIGIPRGYLNRVFERFFRVDKGRSKSEGGTGLGLAIVKHVCNYYNAPISISSIPHKGTEISISFEINF